MNLFIDKHVGLMKNLIGAKVDFIIIGGYSVIFHGYMRTTGDLDIWLKPDNSNKEKLISALAKTGFDKEFLQQVASYDFTKHLAFSIWEEPLRVDFLTIINLVSFEEAEKAKVIAETDGLNVPFIPLEQLVLSKINTGRLKDKADIEELQKIQEAKRNSKK
jgi:predicted nucleotidyltransferase